MWFPGYGIFLFDAEDNYNAIQQGHILEKKGEHLLLEKRVHFFSFSRKKDLFFHFQRVHFMLFLY